jgi:hypothetical protein
MVMVARSETKYASKRVAIGVYNRLTNLDGFEALMQEPFYPVDDKVKGKHYGHGHP